MTAADQELRNYMYLTCYVGVHAYRPACARLRALAHIHSCCIVGIIWNTPSWCLVQLIYPPLFVSGLARAQ